MKNSAEMIPVDGVVQSLEGKGFSSITKLPGSTFRDNSTVIIIPTRGMIHHRVVQAWQGLMAPMNQKRAIVFATGHEVGMAYDAMVENILRDPNTSKWPYIMSLEDDNIPPPDAHIKLIESLEYGNFDAVSGIYFTKGEYGMPMAYGDPDVYESTGVLDFRPRDVRTALQKGHIMPVNGIACGCALWRMDLFRKIPKPWFQTVTEYAENTGTKQFTQDLFFCEKAKRMAAARFAVDFRVRVGHMDVSTGEVY